MIKRSLLAVSIAALGSQSALAAPFMPMDARGLAMGNTGVASAQRAHAPAYNPSLLSQAHESDDFALLFPQIGFNVADEEGLIDEANTIKDDIVPRFENIVEATGQNSLSEKVKALSTASEALAKAISEAIKPANIANNVANAKNIGTKNADFKSKLSSVQTDVNSLDVTTNDLAKALTDINGNPLRGRFGVGAALAIPSKKFAAALTLKADVTGSGRAFFTDQDKNLITGYSKAAKDYVSNASNISKSAEDIQNIVGNGNISPSSQIAISKAAGQVGDVARFSSEEIETAQGTIRIFDNGQITSQAQDVQLNSQVQIKAVAVADLGLSLSREFEIYGEKIAIGITPKFQKIETFHFVTQVDNKDKIEDKDIEDSRTSYSKVNLDIGASYSFGSENNWMFGLVGKNLAGGEFDVADAKVKGSKNNAVVKGGQIALNPQFRAGLAYSNDWVVITSDIDLTENEPVGFEKPTQYAALGAELDIFDTLQLRGGYRSNLSGSNDEVVSLGFGFSPFGVHIDIAAMANPNDPKKEAGVALETGFYF